MLGAAKYVNYEALFRKLVHKSKVLFVKMFNISWNTLIHREFDDKIDTTLTSVR